MQRSHKQCAHIIIQPLYTHAAWDLLRIDVQGFRGLCRDFLKKHPRGYYIAPLRVTGSAVETLFGQFKFSAGGKLDAANYPIARAAFLMKQATQGHYSGSGYRDIPLYTYQIELERKVHKHKSKVTS